MKEKRKLKGKQTDQFCKYFYWDTSANETDTESESDAMDIMIDLNLTTKQKTSRLKNSPDLRWVSSNAIGMQGKV